MKIIFCFYNFVDVDRPYSSPLASLPSPRKQFRQNSLQLVVLWKYLYNLVANLSQRFMLSCRLLRSLTRKSFEYHIRRLTPQIVVILENWYIEIEVSLC